MIAETTPEILGVHGIWAGRILFGTNQNEAESIRTPCLLAGIRTRTHISFYKMRSPLTQHLFPLIYLLTRFTCSRSALLSCEPTGSRHQRSWGCHVSREPRATERRVKAPAPCGAADPDCFPLNVLTLTLCVLRSLCCLHWWFH